MPGKAITYFLTIHEPGDPRMAAYQTSSPNPPYVPREGEYVDFGDRRLRVLGVSYIYMEQSHTALVFTEDADDSAYDQMIRGA